MSKRTITFLLIIIIIFTGHAALFAQSRAVITQIKGKVEVKFPGGAWQGARVGLSIPKGTIISTGFNSSAVVQMDHSVLTVKQLSRLTLEELARSGDEIDTRVFLRSGHVEAEVNPSEGLKHNYKLRSPITTASVRGTGFKSGVKKLFVKHGLVLLSNLINRGGSAGAGEGVWTTNGLDMHTAEEEASKRAEVDIVTNDVPFNWFLYRWFRWSSFWFTRLGETSGGRTTTSSLVIFDLEF